MRYPQAYLSTGQKSDGKSHWLKLVLGRDEEQKVEKCHAILFPESLLPG